MSFRPIAELSDEELRRSREELRGNTSGPWWQTEDGQYAVLKTAVLRDDDLGADARLVYTALSAYRPADPGDTAVWPTLEQLCELTALPKRKVSAALNELDLGGYIDRQRGRRNRATTYYFRRTDEVLRKPGFDELETVKRRRRRRARSSDAGTTESGSQFHSGTARSSDGVTPPFSRTIKCRV